MIIYKKTRKVHSYGKERFIHMGRNCPKCGKYNESDKRFCYNCGSPLIDNTIIKKFCRNCGKQINATASFCPYCGYHLTQNNKEGNLFNNSSNVNNPIYSGVNNLRTSESDRRKNKRVPKTIVSLLLVFAILFTSLVKPGWLRKKISPPVKDNPVAALTSDYNGLPDTSVLEKVALAGKSKAFNISPMDGMQVKAVENALDQDREFKITDIDDETFDKFEQQVANTLKGDLIYAFDIDAGLESTQVLPGKFQIELDLNTLGIPEELQPYTSVVRYVPEIDEPIELAGNLEKGVLTVSSSQNSVFGVVINVIKAICAIKVTLSGAIVAIVVAVPLIIWGLKEWHVNSYFIKNPLGTLSLQTDPRYIMYFKYKDVAMPSERLDTGYSSNLYNNYVESEVFNEWVTEYQKRVEIVRTEAEAEYEKAINGQIKDDKNVESVLAKLIKRAQQRKKAVSKLDKLKFIQEYADNDKELTTIKSQFKLPEVLNVISDSINTSLAYMEDQNIKLPSYVMEYQLLPRSEFSDLQDYGSQDYKNLHSGFMKVNVDSLFIDGNKAKGIGEPNKESMLLTCLHETLHMVQPEYVKERFLIDNDYIGFGILSLGTQWFVNLKYCEMMASQFEFDAATYFYNNGKIKTKPNHDEESEEFKKLGLVSRKHTINYAAELNSQPHKLMGKYDTTPSVSTGYALGDFLDYLRENKRKTTSATTLLNAGYVNDHNIVESLKSAYLIESDEEFSKLWAGYCDEYRDIILNLQYMQDLYDLPSDLSKLYSTYNFNYQIKLNSPVSIVRANNQPYSLLSYRFIADMSTKLKDKGDRSTDKRRYSIYAVPRSVAAEDTSVIPRMVENLNDYRKFDVHNNLYISPTDTDIDSQMGINIHRVLQLICTSKPKENSDYAVVVMFEPDKPNVELKEDLDSMGIVKTATLKIKVPELPTQATEKGYLFGIKTVIKNKITGKEYIIDSNKTTDDLGKEVEKNLGSLGVNWKDKSKAVDIEIFQYQYDMVNDKEVRSPYSVSWRLKRKAEDIREENETQGEPVDTPDYGKRDHVETIDAIISSSFLKTDDTKDIHATIQLNNGNFQIVVPEQHWVLYMNDDPSRGKNLERWVDGYTISGTYNSITTNSGPYGYTSGGREIDFNQDSIRISPGTINYKASEWYTDIWGEKKAGKLKSEITESFTPSEIKVSWGGTSDAQIKTISASAKGKKVTEYDWVDDEKSKEINTYDDSKDTFSCTAVSSSTNFELPNGNWYANEEDYKWDWLIDLGNLLDGRE